MTIGSGAWADRLDALLRDRRELFEAQAEENILIVILLAVPRSPRHRGRLGRHEVEQRGMHRLDRASFRGLVRGCIEAEFCVQIRTLHFSRSTKLTHLCIVPNSKL